MRKLYAPVLEFSLPGDKTVIKFARLNLERWALISEEMRNTAIEKEMKIASQQSDALIAQTLRMRAQAYEPTLGELVRYAKTPNGMIEIFTYAGRMAGTSPDDIRAFIVAATPEVIVNAMDQIIHQPVIDPKDVSQDEVERQNPMLAGATLEALVSAEPSSDEENEPPQPPQSPSTLNSLLAALGPGSPR